jgi:site-specific recombinase XerD
MPRTRRLTLLQSSSPPDALRQALDSFYQRGRARNLSPSTQTFYRVRLEAFVRYLQGRGLELSLEQLAPSILRDFLAAERQRVSAATAQHSYVALRALCRFLVREEVLTENPIEKVEKVRVPRKVIQTFTPVQIEALLAQGGHEFNGARLRAIVLTLVDCGLRVSELCGLDHEHISWDERTLRVMGKGRRERVVPFGEVTRDALFAYLSKRGKLPTQQAVFVTCYGDRLNRHEAHRILSAAGRRAGLTGVRCSPHTFRHTCALMYLRNGGDAFTLQKLLGHSTLEMTRRYCEISETDTVQKHRLASPGDRFRDAVKGAGRRTRLR